MIVDVDSARHRQMGIHYFDTLHGRRRVCEILRESVHYVGVTFSFEGEVFSGVRMIVREKRVLLLFCLFGFDP